MSSTAHRAIRRALLSTLLVAAPAFAADPAPAAGLTGCPPFEELRKQESEKIAAKEVKTPEAKPTKPELRAELLAMKDKDQQARANAAANAKANGGRPETALILAIFQADQDNTRRMRELVDAGEFPNAAQVGRDGIRAAWLVAQHADKDPELQQKLLKLLEPLAAKGEIVPQDFAMLVDRVNTTQGKPQVYGSQFRSVGGIRHPQPIDDAAGLEKRRADAGLIPMRDYGCLLQQFHGIPVDLTPHASVIR